jgi:trans-aconitate methyltransferase
MKKMTLLLLLTSIPCLAMEKENAWNADLYDNNSKPQYEASLEYLAHFDFSLPQFKTIVELGCNTANVSNTLAQRFPDKTFVGIDPEIDAINLGMKKHANSKNVRLICDYAQKYRLQDHDIPLADFVGCYHVLHWIPREDQQGVFNNVAANLAANGIVDVSTSAKQKEDLVTTAVIRTIMKPKWWGYLPYCIPQVVFKGQNIVTLLSAPELNHIATQAGLSVDRCEEVDAYYRWSSKEEFHPWLTSILVPHGIETVFKGKEEDKTKFVNEVIDVYCQDYNPVTDGNIEYRIKALHLTAHKPTQ